MGNEEYKERIDLCFCRINDIPGEDIVKEPFNDFFKREAEFLLEMRRLSSELKAEQQELPKIEVLKERNKNLYKELFKENYASCYGNPDYAACRLGKEYGVLFSALYAELRGAIVYVYEKREQDFAMILELFLECYSTFSDDETPKPEVLKNILYSYNYDYCADFTERRTEEIVDPSLDFARKIIMESDLSDIRYLYRFGEYISENETGIAGFLNKLSNEQIEKMASTYTEGYRIGFETAGKDLSKKKTVNIRYSLGFERMVKAAIIQFEKMGLESVIYRTPTHLMDKRGMKIGYFGGDPNPQFDFDHKNDEGIWLDERFVTRKLAALHEAFENRKQLSGDHAGPACIEVFGEEPFVPHVKENAASLTPLQQELKVRYQAEAGQITNRYIKGEERSFTIIAYPVPEIGEDFEEIFKETVRINTLDYKLYQNIQQLMINALDKGSSVIVKGRNGNDTDIVIKLHDLKELDKETNFENCVADVNIPVGEVFTSPVLKGTNGLLHVKKVYLNGLLYKNLKIEIKDGMTQSYSCGNYEDEEAGRKYIKENILFHHGSLPIGEFAIGTNTTAYTMARKFNIEDKLPILISEKTGPHFAFGDTCYSHEEDMMTYNPDGKAIIARENECSALRKTDISKAYFNCHTDITIPYDELGSIKVCMPDGGQISIIEDGRFVLEGCEELNIPLGQLPIT